MAPHDSSPQAQASIQIQTHFLSNSMAPIRRYLRITKYSVLEVRIYLDNPSQSSTWLLRPNDPALPRIITAVRPYVLPKLREENERARGSKGKGKKGVRDVVSGDDFEVSIFLTDLSTRHTLLTAQKSFVEKPRMQSNSGKLTSWLSAGTKDTPLDLSGAGAEPVLREEDDDGNTINLDDIPDAVPSRPSKGSKRGRTDEDEEALFVASDSESDGFEEAPPPAKRSRKAQKGREENTVEDATEEDMEDDKKKLGMNTQYDGFSIYGRILCLVVKRKGARASAGGAQAASSQQMLENWVSTQAAGQIGDEEDEEG